MYPVLILRAEVVCLVILIFLYFTSKTYKVNSESAFNRMLILAIIHVVFDIITVLTVNHLDTVPSWLNWICHVCFYLSAILFSNEIVNYAIALIYPDKAKKFYYLGHILTAIYICCLSFLRIEYVEALGTNSSAGPAAVVGYGLAFVLFVSALILIFTHWKSMPVTVKTALIPMMLVLIVTEICQMIWRSVLFTGSAITIVTVGMFFTLENPVAVFKKKAMTDTLTGVRSRRSCDEDIEACDKKFQKNPNNDFIFVFADINDLRLVNNHYGHDEGDNYIILISSAIISCMKHCTAIYRIGGDEFLILYHKVNPDIVEKELKDTRDACAKASVNLEYNASISAGYAQSSDSYKSLNDVIKAADYAMYQNKTSIKSGDDYGLNPVGIKLNYTGLTDKTFEVMCASNNRSYPFITNLETGVTRIAPGWKEFFGLDSEFFSDFMGTWKDRIHPDDYEGYMADIVSLLNGHKKYHQYDYLAKKADGEYVSVSCYGSVYRDASTGINYFTGFIVNHALDDNVDAVTGLRNFECINPIVSKYLDKGKPYSLLKLALNNFARINILYGYNTGTKLSQSIAEILTKELPENSEVFCQNAHNFTILFDTDDDQVVKDYYSKVFDILAAGIETEHGNIPISLSGGAYINNGERIEIERARSGLMYAVEESHYTRRNKLVFYRSLESENMDENLSLLSKIHADALSDMTCFNLRYQPIVDLKSCRTIGAEALLRWTHPIYGDVLPGKFIAFLENDPCYYRLGLKIIEDATRDAKKIQQTHPDFRISVNITALQLRNENFVDDVEAVLKKIDFAPDSLVLELTERCKEMDVIFLSKKIADLRSRGIKVAFDDLGTGYSSINLLMDITIDEIKLDKDFVKDLETNKSYRLFVNSLVLGSQSSSTGYSICFEGIETEEMLETVRSFGDFKAQGYYFAKPLKLEEFEEYIDRLVCTYVGS